MQKTKKAFTLVELIVVITILAILGTIAFISLQGYSKKARDSKRTSDIANIKVSLELFSLNTGYYPLPDNGEEVLYDNDLLWTQGIVGTNVTTNLSRNLLKKPTDPLHDIEYVYSLASSKKEYEVMSIYEGDLATNNLMNSTYALDKYSVKVEGNYNELFVKTSKYIFPVPSLITSAPLPLDFDLVPSAIESQVITGGDNFPGLNIPNIETSTGALKMTLSVYTGNITKDSEDDDKKAVVEKIQLAYSGSDIETTSIYKTLLAKTTDEELLAFVDDVVLNKTSSVVIETSDTDAPTGGDFSMDTETSSVDITLTITCPEEALVEMHISGDIVGTSEWESCMSSKGVELSSGDGSKSINVKWRDNEGNETEIINNNITILSIVKYLFRTKGSAKVYAVRIDTHPNWTTSMSNSLLYDIIYEKTILAGCDYVGWWRENGPTFDGHSDLGVFGMCYDPTDGNSNSTYPRASKTRSGSHWNTWSDYGSSDPILLEDTKSNNRIIIGGNGRGTPSSSTCGGAADIADNGTDNYRGAFKGDGEQQGTRQSSNTAIYVSCMSL